MKIILRDEKSATDSRRLSAELNKQGDLVFAGLDQGVGVREVFNYDEYEWVWTIKAQDLPALHKALGSEGELLNLIAERFSGEHAAGILGFLEEHSVPHEAWSRVGD